MELKNEAKDILIKNRHEVANASHEFIPKRISFDQVDRIQGQPMTTAASTSVTGMGIHKEREPSGTSYSNLLEEVSPYQADTSRGGSAAIGGVQPVDPTHMQLDVTDTDYKPEAKKFKRTFYDKKCEQDQHMPTAASASATGTGIHEEGRQSGATVSESTWRFEISNKPDHLKSGSILPYPMEIFVPTGALSEITELKVTVTQMTDNNHPSPSIPGNRQLGPIIRFEADQAHIQFVRPLLVLVRFPEEFLKHTDDYEYRVQYNSDKDIHGGTWSDITGYNEGQVCGEVIPSHQTAVLLLPHFCWFAFFRKCRMMTVELYAYPPQLQNTRTVLVTCLVYLQPLYKNQEYKAKREDIKGEYNSSESINVSQIGNEEQVSLTAMGYESEQWRLKEVNLKTQKIPIDTILENNFMTKHFVFQGQGQLEFSCNIATKIPGCSDANPQVLILPQERDQAVKNPSSEHGKNAANDLSGSVQPVENTKPLFECINPGFLQHLNSKERDRLLQTTVNYKEVINSNGANSTTEISMNITNLGEGLFKELNVTDDNYKVQVDTSTKEFYEEKREQAYPMDTTRKGSALVINVQCKGAKNERKGTDIDRNKIVSLLEQLDFESPTVYNDEDELTHEDILDNVKAFALLVPEEAQRVAVFILSHGDDEDVICGTDGKTVPVQELVDAINVHRLAGIPKMVVFQACRGGNTETEQKDNSGPPDLITCYSSKKGYVSYRKPTEGSWFIAALVQVFEKHAHEFEILELMNMVQTEVGVKRTTRGECQTTDTVHNLQKEWFFFPGFPKF